MIRIKTSSCCLLLAALLLVSGVVHALETAESQLEDLVAEALERNPDLQAAEARWKMAEHQIVPAGSLDDPRLSLSLSNYPLDSLSGNETPMTGKEIQLSQMFPFPGKLGEKKKMAQEQALWYRGAYEEARLQLAQAVKDAWYRLYYQQQAIVITRENLDVLQDFLRMTETRYEVGTGLQQDVLKAQVEWSKLQDRVISLEQQKTTLVAELNRLLNRPPGKALEISANLKKSEINQSRRQLLELARKYRPLFMAYQAMVDRYQGQRNLARLDYYPDFTLWAGYRQREEVMGDPTDGEDFVSAGVSLNVPLWRKKRGEAVAEADSGLRMVQRQLEDLRNQIDFEISDQYAQLVKNRQLLDLFGTGILPQAAQGFEASLSAYQVGDVDFLNLLDSLMTHYRYQIDYQRALTDYERNIAKLEAAVGRDLGEKNIQGEITRDIQDSQD